MPLAPAGPDEAVFAPGYRFAYPSYVLGGQVYFESDLIRECVRPAAHRHAADWPKGGEEAGVQMDF